jgi:hypothetical protein
VGNCGRDQFGDFVRPVISPGIGPGNPYFSTAAFAPVTTVAFGTANRDSLRGPGIFNLDVAIDRTFNLGERFKLQLRAEGFSITNTPHFANPNANISGSNFGIVTSTLGASGSGTSAVSDGSRKVFVGARLLF